MYPLKHSLGTALSTSLNTSVYINLTYMTGLTKLSHVAPKMQHVTLNRTYVSTKIFFWNCTLNLPQQCVHQFYVHDRTHKTVTCRTKNEHVTFCNSIVRFFLCLTYCIDSVCGVTWIPLCAKGGSVITWDRGEGETLSIHVVTTQCAGVLNMYFSTQGNILMRGTFESTQLFS